MNKKQEGKQKKSHATSASDLFDINVFPARVSDTGFSILIRSLLQNWRQGTVTCKGRSDVSYSNKKPWKQKGTGRARSGSARSPIWRGGGVTFGPQPRVRKLSVPKKLRTNAIASMIRDFVENDKIIKINWAIEGDKPQTSAAYNVLKAANIDVAHEKIIVLLPVHDVLMNASLRNIPNVRVMFFDQINCFDLAKSNRVVFFEKDLHSFKEMVSKWI